MVNPLRLPPQPPGYDLTTGDLQRAGISPEQAARFLMQRTGGNGAAVDGESLLAAILKGMFRASTVAQAVAYSLPPWTMIQLQGGDYYRNYFELQNVGAGDLMLVFEAGSNTAQDMSAADDQAKLTLKQTYAFRIVAGGMYAPFVAPVNPVTIFTLGTGTNGVLMIGKAP